MASTTISGFNVSGKVKFAIRYVGRDPRGGGKDITSTEAAALKVKGIARVVVYQPRRAFVPLASDNGAVAARIADQDAKLAGMPPTRPIYFAVDGDTRGFSATQWLAIENFFRGVISVIGLARVGAYGGKNTVEHLRNRGLIRWLWQTYAWSGGQWADVHLRQYDNGNPMCEGEVDYDRSMKQDYGQW